MIPVSAHVPRPRRSGTCYQCGGPLGSLAQHLYDSTSGSVDVCGPKCLQAFNDDEPREGGFRATTADDLNLQAGAADIDGGRGFE